VPVKYHGRPVPAGAHTAPVIRHSWRTTGLNVYYYLDDMLGSARVTDASTCDQDYKFEGKERDAETGNDNFGARYFTNRLGRWLSADWSSIPEPVPYANLTNPQTLNLYAMVSDNPETFADLDGHCGQTTPGAGTATQPCSNGANTHAVRGEGFSDIGISGIAALDCSSASCTATAEASAQSTQIAAQEAAQQQYGRQANGSYKADPAEVQAAIKAGKPILEPGNPDHKSECVFACKALSHMKNIGTSQWPKGKAAVDLNDTTDIGLAIATLGSGRYPSQNGNSGIYMGHDANGGIKIVDQGRDNGPEYNHPFEHTLTRHDEGPAMDPNAYFVIIVPKP
jgi:RHS repeat-associated protein